MPSVDLLQRLHRSTMRRQMRCYQPRYRLQHVRFTSYLSFYFPLSSFLHSFCLYFVTNVFSLHFTTDTMSNAKAKAKSKYAHVTFTNVVLIMMMSSPTPDLTQMHTNKLNVQIQKKENKKMYILPPISKKRKHVGLLFHLLPSLSIY